MSVRRWFIVTMLFMAGVIVLLNQLAAAHRRDRRDQMRGFVARLDQHVEPESLRRWVATVIASGEGREGFVATNAPGSLAVVYGHVPYAVAHDGPPPGSEYVTLTGSRASPGLVVGSTNLNLAWEHAQTWREGIYVLPPRD